MRTTRISNPRRLWHRVNATARSASLAWLRWRSAFLPILPF